MNLKNYITITLTLVISANLSAQTFDVGHSSISFFDSSRDRDIETEIYYPSDIAGEDVAIASGNHPVIVFGHGFLMTWEAYENFWTELVPQGYVLCFPTTESDLTPDHQEFGQDLKFIASQMQIENQDITSVFYNSLASETGLMGHSMGGGASFLAAENNSEIQTLVNFAAAETNPSAIEAAANISVPCLMFSGDDDCVTPPADHQDIMFDSLNSYCKTQVNIIDGGHCYFADFNFNCNLGELFCNPGLDITRLEQQDVTNDFLSLWLDYSLKGNLSAFDVFNDSLQTSNRINFEQECNSVDIASLDISFEIKISPNPIRDKINLMVSDDDKNGLLTIYNSLGERVYQNEIINTKTQIDMSVYANGTYLIAYTRGILISRKRIIKMDE